MNQSFTLIRRDDGADQHIRTGLGFSILPKDTLTCRLGESNQRPFDNKMLVVPLSLSSPVSLWSLNVETVDQSFILTRLKHLQLPVTDPPADWSSEPLRSGSADNGPQ